MAKATIEFDDGDMHARIRGFDRRLNRAIGGVFEDESAYATAYLRARAPWIDDTGRARATLMAVANDLGPGGHELVLRYGVTYGVYLESMESGRYAVITPSMRVLGAHVLSSLNGLIDRMRSSTT